MTSGPLRGRAARPGGAARRGGPPGGAGGAEITAAAPGASRRRPRARTRARRPGPPAAAVLAAILAGAAPAAAQDPDTVPPPPPLADTLPIPLPDTLVLPDTSGVLVLPDTALAPPPDEEPVPPETEFHRIPDIVAGPPPGIATGIWVFEREDILGSRALTLAELVGTLPGVMRLRGGDFGNPRAVTAFGLAGGGVRVFWDGVEMPPLDGGVTDLARVGLGGVERVRVERHPGELRIELTSLRNADPRPYSLVEAGTGDLSTNVFRGTFVHPRALAGSLGLSLDRIDTRGREGAETGNQQGLWLRYTWHGGDRLAVTGELRRMKAETEVPDYPATSTRVDWVVRARARLTRDLVAEAFTGQADLEADLVDVEEPDPDQPFGPPTIRRERRQHGLHAAWTPGPLWARGALRVLDGDAVPSTSLELSGGGDLAGVGGASASVSSESWGDDRATLLRLQAWTAPLFGVSGFATWTSGGRGVRLDTLPTGIQPPAPAVPYAASHRLADRSALRLGAAWRWRGAEVAGALLTLDTDSLPLLGTPLDRDGLVLPGVERRGWEIAGRLPIPGAPEGFALTGSLQQWDEGARYLPPRQYQAAVDFHDRFLPTGNLEVWGGLGVQGRDPMLVPLAAAEQPEEDPDAEPAALPVLANVPFFQSWYLYLQARVVTVRIFIRWENASVRLENQDFPGRLLPRTRALYGVRWTLWN